MVTYNKIHQLIKRVVGPIARMAKLSVSRGIVSLADDSTTIQSLQVELLDGQTRDNVEHFQPFGLSAHPTIANTPECVALAVGGNQDHPIVLGVSDRTARPKNMSEGETKLYNGHDSSIYLNDAGEIIIENAGSATITLGHHGEITIEDSTGSQIKLDSGSGNISIKQSGAFINLAGASDFVALAAKVDSAISSVITGTNTAITAINLAMTVFDAHQQSSTATFQPLPPGSGGQVVTVAAPMPPMVAAIPLLPAISVAATEVKAS